MPYLNIVKNINFCYNYNNLIQLDNLFLKGYCSTIQSASLLDTLEEEKFMNKLSDEERLEERLEAKEEKAIEIAKNLLDVLNIETIAKKTGLSIEVIKELEK